MEEPFKRRRTSEDLGINNLITDDVLYLSPTRHQSPWSDNLFAGTAFSFPDQPWSPTSSYHVNRNNRKRNHHEIQPYEISSSDSDRSKSHDDYVEEIVNRPINFQNRQRDLPTHKNPFLSISRERHPPMQNRQEIGPKNLQIDSYVKVRIGADGVSMAPVHWPKSQGSSRYRIPDLPANFGRNFKMDPLDFSLMKFFVVGICSGRSLIPRSNGWLVVLCPMAEMDECIRHCLLAFSSGYALDLYPTERVRVRANYHYRKAVSLLSEKLKDPRNYQDYDKVELIVAALRIFWSDHIVNWELRGHKQVQWFEAVQVAKQYMAITDPGYRYWKPCNVQSSAARLSNANMAAYVDIMSQPLTPLTEQITDNCHPWLLEGQKKETVTINGGTGVSPKLLHIFGQITHLCVMLGKDEHSRMIVHGADGVEKVIIGLRQRSDLSEGYDSPEALLASNRLDNQGQVTTPAEVTDLTAEAWRQAALLYIRCRFYRLPRGHPEVQKPLSILLRCVERMPASGKLFTSQSPLSPIFIAGLVASHNRERRVVEEWFRTVTSTRSRSSVPPLWRALQTIWDWMDTTKVLAQDPNEDGMTTGHRFPWWESLAQQVWNNEGRIPIV